MAALESRVGSLFIWAARHFVIIAVVSLITFGVQMLLPLLQVQRWADARESLPAPTDQPPAPEPEPVIASSP